MDTKTKKAKDKAQPPKEASLPEGGISGEETGLEVPPEEVEKAQGGSESLEEIDLQTLFPEVEVQIGTDRYLQIKPWSGNTTAQVFKIIGDTIGKLRRDRTIDWANADQFLGTICFTSFGEVCHIVAVTINWSLEDVKNLPFPVILKLVRVIQEQNLDLVTVKNLIAVVNMGKKYLV